MAYAQKGNKPKGGMKPGKPNPGMGGAGGGNREKKEQFLARNLPPAFQGLSDAEVVLLSKLCQRSVSWMKRDTLPDPAESSVASVFGHFQAETAEDTHAASQSSSSGAAHDARLENIGLLVLTKLNLDQRRELAKVLPEQQFDIKESLALRTSLVRRIAEIRNQKTVDRTVDVEARKALRDLSRLETVIAARQARAFAELNKSLSKNQRESLQLICHSPVESMPSREAIREVEEELENASDGVKVAFQRLAANAALWMGLDSMSTAATMDFELPSSNEPASDQFLPTYLAALSPAQQNELISLLAGRVRAETQATAAQQQIQVTLIGLRTNRSLDERRLDSAMEANLEIIYSTSRAEASTFEQLMNSLSKAQREHFESTLNLQFPSDKPSKKSSSGKL
ncbi:MAG: hypothetical protein U0936_09690 [Planctomycetaceae bacterium]